MGIRPRRLLIPGLAVLATLSASTVAVIPSGDSAAAQKPRKGQPDAHDVVLAVHGGAGTSLDRDDTSSEEEKAYRGGLTEALRAGQAVLKRGGSSVEATEAAVRTMEDNPLFNAGKGAVFTEDGTHELDASIMRGSDLKAGAVAGVRHVKNPVSAARAVMEKSENVLLQGKGADDFAAKQGLQTVPQSYYWTKKRWDQLQEAQGKSDSNSGSDSDSDSDSDGGSDSGSGTKEAPEKNAAHGEPDSDSAGEHADSAKGTVGAVALDRKRDLAAATSTGGLTNKKSGRVGDSPLIGSGTYADNATVAASATGHGEVFIRGAATSTLAHLIEFGGKDVASAAYQVVIERLPRLGGDGGVIALGPNGDFDAPHSSKGMLLGYLTGDGQMVTKVFPDETPSHT